MPDVTRIIEQNATESIYNDDWVLIDRPTEGEDGGTRKILVSRLKELLCGDYIADEWVAGETYANGAIVSHEGKLYYNKSGGALVQTIFNSNAWLEVKIDELLEKVIGSVGEKWRLVDTYHYDDLVVYGGRLYRCIKNTSTQGTWVSNEWIEANAEYYFKKVREYIARYGFVPRREAISSPYNKGDLILYRAPGDTTNSLYMRLNDTEYGDPTWIPENWLKVENIGGALKKIYEDMAESDSVDDIVADEVSLIDENKVADLTPLAMIGTASGDIASFDEGSGLPFKSLVVNIEPQQEGSGDPSPENIRPISGWDEVNVTVCGKNLFDRDNLRRGVYTNADGTTQSGSATTNFSSQFIKVMPNTTYSITMFDGSYENGSLFGIYYDENKNGLNQFTNILRLVSNESKTFTTPSNAYYIVFTGYRGSGTDIFTTANTMVCEGTPTTYEPYNGHTYTIDLDGTRYGGKLDVVSGVLTVDRVYKKFDGTDTTGWRSSGTYGISSRFDNQSIIGKPLGSIISNMFVKSTVGNDKECISLHGSDGFFILLIHTDRLATNDVAGLMNYFSSNNLEICYELATPITVQLAPTQVKSLLGVNNIWADTGDVLDAEYIRDTTTIINSLIARIEALENQ